MTNKSDILNLLLSRVNQWVPGNELVAAGGGYRYGGRIEELRKAGWVIERRPDPEKRSRVHQYRLVSNRPVAGQVSLPW